MKNTSKYINYILKNKILNYINAKTFGNLFERQNSKWFIVPFKLSNIERSNSKKLIELDDSTLEDAYEKMEIIDSKDNERGWYRDKYVGEFKGKKVLDLGCGTGKDGLFFAKGGANLTFADVVKSNLDLVKKMTHIYKLNANFFHIKSFEDYSKIGQFDFIWAQGSLHHNPIHLSKIIIKELSTNFVKDQRFLLLSYPKERWIHDGYPLYRNWGNMTDGAGTPWAQPFEKDEIKYLFSNKSKILFQKKWNIVDNINSFIFFDILCN